MLMMEQGKTWNALLPIKRYGHRKNRLVVLTRDIATDGNPEKTYKEF